MNIQLSYKDNQNWATINGNAVYWGDYYELFKESRVVPTFLAPEIVTENWNGKTIDVQHKRWDAYYLEFLVREEEINEINKLQSCSDIVIKDLDSNIRHDLTIENFEHIEISEPEPQDTTTIYKVSIKYRINETIINKIDTLSNKSTVVCNNTYHSKFDKLNFAQSPEAVTVKWSDNSDKVLRTITKTGYKTILFLSNSEYTQFISDFTNYNLTIDSINVIEKRISSDDIIGEDLHRIELELITDISVKTDNINLLNGTNNLQITYNTIIYNYYTNYPVLQTVEDAQFDSIDNENGYKDAVKITTRYTYVAKFYLDAAKAFQLKEQFANGTATINSINIIEKNNVEINQLDYDLYEVVVKCLTNVQLNYPYN